MTVAELLAFVKRFAPASGAVASLAQWTRQTVQGYMGANDASANLHQMIALVHNTGDDGGAILLAEDAYETVAVYTLGARITLPLEATSWDYNSYGFYNIN